MKNFIFNILNNIEWVFSRIEEIVKNHFGDPPLIDPIFYELFEREDWIEIEKDILKGIDRTVTLKNGETITLTTKK